MINEEQLIKLLEQYANIEREQAKRTQNLKEAIRNLNEAISEIEKPFLEKLKTTEEAIKPIALEMKSTFECEFGKITYKKGITRRSWNMDALDQVMDARPEIKEVIAPFKTVTVGEPSIKIEV